MGDTRQLLVILHDESARQTATRLEGLVRVLSRLPSRLFVVDADDAALARLRDEPGVLGVYDREAPADVLATLRPDEQLFAGAWAYQASRAPKVRAGDGASWDAPGFEPPDLPPRRR